MRMTLSVTPKILRLRSLFFSCLLRLAIASSTSCSLSAMCMLNAACSLAASTELPSNILKSQPPKASFANLLASLSSFTSSIFSFAFSSEYFFTAVVISVAPSAESSTV